MSGTTVLAAIAFGLGAVGTHCAILVARSCSFFDHPDDGRKRHAQATPLLGGLAVCVSVVVTVAIGSGAGLTSLFDSPHRSQLTASLLVTLSGLCALGLWDDRWGMSARNKLLLQVVAILPFAICSWCLADEQSIRNANAVAWVGLPLTLLWLVSCTNFVNLIDGLDGLAGSLVVVVGSTVAVLAAVNGWPATTQLAVITAAGTGGFLVFNWPPARIFLGDSGSLPLGFLVGALSLEGSSKRAASLTLILPVVLLAVPLFDTMAAIVRRKLTGRHIGQGDREHIHHCLRDRGLTPQQTLLSLIGMSLLTAGGVIAAAVFDQPLVAFITAAALGIGLIAGRVFGFKEWQLVCRHAATVASWVRRLPRSLRLQLLVAQTEAHADGLPMWPLLVSRVQRLQGVLLKLECTVPVDDVWSRGAVHRRVLGRLQWRDDAATSIPEPHQAAWEVSLSTPRDAGVVVTLTALGPDRSQAMGRLPVSPKRFNDLCQLIETFGRACPIDENALQAAIEKTKDTSPAIRLVVAPSPDAVVNTKRLDAA
jgi:UDP-GlcNAc:undecaprenyl-phosphate GlcNAc-1-phosphate transferase